MSARLKGSNIVVTRPAHQADALCQRLETEGAGIIRFPVIEIAEPRDKDTLDGVINRLTDFDLAIFISPNAVDYGLRLIQSRSGFPRQLPIAAVGLGSARALEKHGLHADIFPQHTFNSEALLALPELQTVSRKKIVIFRGEGGRELLADTLRVRGAEVVYAECYRRIVPKIDISPLLKHWQHDAVDIILVTSNDGLNNLYNMVGHEAKSYLLQTPLVVISQRMCTLSKKLGFTHKPVVAESASDEALLNAVLVWRSDQQASTIL